MRCPFCGKDDTQVKDSRPTDDGSIIRRRRFCGECDSRFTTFERVQIRELIVVKKDGRKKPFEREKLTRSLNLAFRKRTITQDQIGLAVNNIVQQLESSAENEVSSAYIGQLVMEILSKLDPVAYVRFASVYREFREAKDFGAFIDTIDK